MFRDIQAKWDNKVDSLCVLCRGDRETEEHVLLECSELNEEREMMLGKFRELLGPERWERFGLLDQKNQMTWLLGLNAEVAKLGRGGDWMEIFRWVGKMVYYRDESVEEV